MSWSAKTRHDREHLQPFHDKIKDVSGRLNHAVIHKMTKAQVRAELHKDPDDQTSLINRMEALVTEIESG